MERVVDAPNELLETVRRLQSKYYNLLNSTTHIDREGAETYVIARNSLHLFLCPDLSSYNLTVNELEQAELENLLGCMVTTDQLHHSEKGQHVARL